jgi:site-specific DNA-methyltransferase (adenine-specific)
MKNIPDNSIDMVLCDPPYGTTSHKWDNVIPFEPMWNELKRITKDSGAICLFGSEPFSSTLRMSNINGFKYDWYWNKSHTPDFLKAKFKPKNYIEICSVFSNTAMQKTVYRPQGVIDCDIKQKTGDRKDSGFLIKGKAQTSYKQTKTNYPRTDIKFSNLIKKEDKYHPTQKPVALLEYLIKTYTLESETVLDFTMGSGSTGVACKNLSRKFIGIELEKKYYDIAVERINNE